MSDDSGWLQISTDGFASFNQGRPAEHLVKELVQNAFDAVCDTGGTVELSYHHDGHSLHIECNDTGCGIDDLSAMRVVYLTSKTDSHLKRGRFGRGFKEILSVAQSAVVLSGGEEIRFIVEGGKQITRRARSTSPVSGSRVSMTFDWPEDQIARFDDYFERFLVPEAVVFKLNGRMIASRNANHSIDAQLTTEVYAPESQSWRKPRRKTKIELVNAHDDEEPFIYEMGIPVAPADWSVPYHADIQQRVPMNPNRDALASRYAKRIHTACLPMLLAELDEEEATADWVGTAGVETPAEIQREILDKAFGAHAVRSVPKMGKRDYDDDAERIGSNVVRTSQLSSGFREMAKAHLPSAKETVDKTQKELEQQIAESRFDPHDISDQEDPRGAWIEKRGGQQHVDTCLAFAVWFCQKLVDSAGGSHTQPPVTGSLALGQQPQLFVTQISKFSAHWSDSNTLTLALDYDCFWEDPLGAETLSILIHEAAHAQNMNHGKGFNEEVERLGGVGARMMFEHHDEVQERFGSLLAPQKAPPIPLINRLLGTAVRSVP